MPKTPYLIQINDGPGSKSRNDLCLGALNVEKGSQRVGRNPFAMRLHDTNSAFLVSRVRVSQPRANELT